MIVIHEPILVVLIGVVHALPRPKILSKDISRGRKQGRRATRGSSGSRGGLVAHNPPPP